MWKDNVKCAEPFHYVLVGQTKNSVMHKILGQSLLIYFTISLWAHMHLEKELYIKKKLK